jgi:predicted Zn-dependent peptidase
VDDQLEPAFDLFADMLVEPLFDENELKSEQRVIIEEMKMTDDSPEDLLGELFSKEFFPDDPLGRPIAGTPETVMTFDSSLTRQYHAENFRPGNLVIAAAGNVEHERLVELADRAFGSRSRKTEEGRLKAELKTQALAAPIIVHQKPDLEQAHLIIGLPFIDARDQRRYAADLLANAIGGGMSSRLWQKIREDRGLAYSVGTSNAMYRDVGVFSIFAGTSPEQVGEVVDISMAELRAVVNEGITDAELELAKHQARASVLLSLEDSASRAAALAQSEMTFGRQIPVEETLANIDAVTTDDAVALAREFFKTEAVAFAALGDLDGLKMDRDRLSL